MDSSTIANRVMASFIGEIEAFKPGNVSRYSDAHDMTVQDFLLSAEISVPALCETGSRIGERILNSVRATRKAVACNTNLGMLLLFAPIIVAAESSFDGKEELRAELKRILAGLNEDDADRVYQAIRLANPGGLGSVKDHDVRQPARCSLQKAMQIASPRDFIAMQYSNDFHDIFDTGLPVINCFVKRWNSVKWATVSCYLTFLSSLKDSHIERKYGTEIAEQLMIKTSVIADKFNQSSDPDACINLLQEFDEELKTNDHNPGTSADLTAASLMVYNLTNK